MMNILGKDIPIDSDVDLNQVSDGYHTFGELYACRHLLFIALLKQNPYNSWRANKDSNGVFDPDWFLAGIHLTTGDISFHIPRTYWHYLDYCGLLSPERAPKFDGHTTIDVLDRLSRWITDYL